MTQAQENPIADNTLSHSEGQKESKKKKRKKEAEELRIKMVVEGLAGPGEASSWQAALAWLEDKLDTFIMSTDAWFKTLEEHAERNLTLL